MVGEPMVSFRTDPQGLRHWELDVAGAVATLTMRVSPDKGLRDDYELKLNSYDLSVDIELADIATRLRFEHPEVKVVVVTGGLDKVFCAGANIQMLCTSSHAHKVNFCKLTNETRNAIEESGTKGGQGWVAAVNGTAAGGGYELALACDEIVMVDDRASTVSLPEVPLLAVLPGTGGLTRLVDKRFVRRDLADVFATRTEGLKAPQALSWGLVDSIAPRSEFATAVADRAATWVARSDRPDTGPGIQLSVFGSTTTLAENGSSSDFVDVDIDRALRVATFTVRGPAGGQPLTAEELLTAGEDAWIVRAALELDHAMLHLRFNEPEIGTWVLQTIGSPAALLGAEAAIDPLQTHWLGREARLLWARVFKRLDLSARTLIAVVEPNSCFVGMLAELALAADRSYHLDGPRGDDGAVAMLELSPANDGWFPMSNGLSRLETRFWGRPDALAHARKTIGTPLCAREAIEAELVTFGPDDLDWEDDIRLVLEERASFSPDALTGMEANFRFVGPETVETKIFARLSAWQNWIFQRPNAIGPDGALHRYGTGSRPVYDKKRV